MKIKIYLKSKKKVKKKMEIEKFKITKKLKIILKNFTFFKLNKLDY